MRKIFFTIGFFIFVQINILAQTTYTTRASFDAAATGIVEVLNFDNLSDGTTIPSGNSLNVGTNIGNATFTYSIPSTVLRVRDQFPTTSGSLYLGVNTNGSEASFFGGDSFTITFPQAVQGFGLYIIVASTTNIFSGDFSLTVNTGGAASSSASVDPGVSVSGAKVYFVGIRKATGFTSVTFNSVSASFSFDLDDFAAETLPASTAPEIALSANSNNIPDGSTLAAASTSNGTDFANVCVEGASATITYTITNSGTADLDLTGSPLVDITSGNTGDFTVTTQPATDPIPHTTGNTTTFIITFNPTASGSRSATVSIANNDSDENPFDFVVKGEGILPEVTVASFGSASVAENSGSNLVYRFTRSNCTSGTLAINFSIAGTAADADYTVTTGGTGLVTYSVGTNTGTITFPNGISTVDLTVTPTGDVAIEADETVIVTVGTP